MLLLILVCIVIYSIYHAIVYSYWTKRNVTNPKPFFVFGNVWEILTIRKSLDRFLFELYNTYTKDPYVGFFNMHQPALLVRDANMIKDILIKDFDYFQDNWYTADRKVDPLLGLNPFVLKGDEWKKSRKFIGSSLTSVKVKSVFYLIQSGSANMLNYIEQLKDSSKSQCVEITDVCSRFTCDNVMNCGYGLEANSFLQQNPEGFKITGFSSSPLTSLMALKRTLGLMSQTMQKILNVTFVGNPTADFFTDIIKKEVRDRLRKGIVRHDFLNHLMGLSNKGYLAESDLSAHAFTLVIDGFQTSSATMSYALLELSSNPQIQEIARNEVYTALRKYGEISYEALQELEYVQAVIYETLRKHPTIKIMAKVCTKQYDLKDVSGRTCLTIEEGTPVFISIRGIHGDSKHHQEPGRFDPGRFIEDKQKGVKCSFLGFGEGPRICIGRTFALVQLVAGLAAILQHFDLKLNDQTTFPLVKDKFHISDVPTNGVYIDFNGRSFQEFV